MNDQIPPSLQRFGDDLHRAARRELTDDPGSMRPGVRRPRVAHPLEHGPAVNRSAVDSNL